MRTTPRGKQYDRELVCLHQVLIYDSDGDGDDDDDGDSDDFGDCDDIKVKVTLWTPSKAKRS